MSGAGAALVIAAGFAVLTAACQTGSDIDEFNDRFSEIDGRLYEEYVLPIQMLGDQVMLDCPQVQAGADEPPCDELVDLLEDVTAVLPGSADDLENLSRDVPGADAQEMSAILSDMAVAMRLAHDSDWALIDGWRAGHDELWYQGWDLRREALEIQEDYNERFKLLSEKQSGWKDSD